MDVVQALLTGKYAQECLEGEKIQESLISGYVSGRRRISLQMIYAIGECGHAELVRRMEMVNLHNCDGSAQNVRRFLEETQPVGETETQRLLAYGEQCETPLDFLAEVFLAALRCPPGEVGVLKEDAQRRLRDGDFSEAGAGESACAAQRPLGMAAEEADEGGDVFDYQLRQCKLRTLEGRARIRRRLDAMMCSEAPGMGRRAPVIREGEEEMEAFWEEWFACESGEFYEIEGTNAQLRETVRRLPALNNCKGAALLIDSNPDIGMPDFYAIRDVVAARSQVDARVIAGLRISNRTDGRSALHIAIIGNPAKEGPRRRPPLNARTPVRRKKPF